MILGYLVRKINILLFIFILTGCSSVKNNISNMYDDIFVEKEVSCPSILTPKGSEEFITISEINQNPSYVGFRGIKKTCFLSDNKIKINLAVNLRSVRKNFQNVFSLKASNNDESFNLFVETSTEL